MRKLALFALAAGVAMTSTSALAQVVTSPGPVFGGTGPGTTMQGRFHGGFRGGTMGPHGRTFVHGGMFPHHLQPGFVVPPFWFGPQFHVNNWQMYGFTPPPPRHRWVRYYDDAYLIDDGGRIRDARRGLDWDRYGERWDMEEGIPHYYGRGDFRPGPDDYAWVERNRGRFDEDDYDYAEYGPEDGPGYGPHGPPPGYGGPPPGYGSPPPGCHPGPQPCGGEGYGGYGYGYGYGGVLAYAIVIETTVVSGGCGCCCYEEVVEEVVEVRQRARPRPRRHRPPPPPPGERG